VIVSENDTDEDFQWENMENCVRQREAFCNVCERQNSTKYVSEIVECFKFFLVATWSNTTGKSSSSSSSTRI
jgi:hypothetical protein